MHRSRTGRSPQPHPGQRGRAPQRDEQRILCHPAVHCALHATSPRVPIASSRGEVWHCSAQTSRLWPSAGAHFTPAAAIVCPCCPKLMASLVPTTPWRSSGRRCATLQPCRVVARCHKAYIFVATIHQAAPSTALATQIRQPLLFCVSQQPNMREGQLLMITTSTGILMLVVVVATTTNIVMLPMSLQCCCYCLFHAFVPSQIASCSLAILIQQKQCSTCAIDVRGNAEKG